MKNNIIFASSTPRSGGTLLTNIVSVHPDIVITKDLVHFFRYIYKKYKPIKNKKNLYRLFCEFSLRLKFRNNIKLNPIYLYRKFTHLKPSYKNIYIVIADYILKKTNKKIFGENANSEWHNISSFLKLDNNFKAYQGIRDPRAVLMSWKNVTYETGNKYLIMIFYWLDAIQEMEKNLKKFKERFIFIKFEDIHSFPFRVIPRLYNFLGLEFKRSFFENKNFIKQKKNPFIHINVSGHSNKQVIGFSKKRTTAWKNKIHKWEIAVTQYFLGNYMKKYGYKLIKVNLKDLKEGLKKIENEKMLKKLFLRFKKTKKGTHKRLSDPAKPENWSATNYSKNIKLKFIETPDYKKYMNELNKIKKIKKIKI